SYGGMTVGGVAVGAREIGAADLARIDRLRAAQPDALTAVPPELVGTSTANGHRVLLMGVRPVDQFRLKRWWSVNAGRPPANDDELVAGSRAAAALRLQMGDYVRLAGRRFTVTGLLRPTGSQDDRLLIADLGAAQRVLHRPGLVSMVELAARDPRAVDGLVRRLSAELPGLRVAALQQAVAGSRRAVDQFRSFSYAIVGVVIVIEALVVFVTMMGSVNERTREIGVFRAVGFTGGHVVRLVLIEAVVASLLAGVIGYLVGMGVSAAVLPFVASAAALVWTPLLALVAVALALVVGAAASLYPALHASRLDPTEALRAL
ncbi:MAG TPA: FtsX-like permease family protein, partial [Thermoleophilia bacterium]|nr:FtsX-like permease family protein [Thermoleophilia bacterium]